MYFFAIETTSRRLASTSSLFARCVRSVAQRQRLDRARDLGARHARVGLDPLHGRARSRRAPRRAGARARDRRRGGSSASFARRLRRAGEHRQLAELGRGRAPSGATSLRAAAACRRSCSAIALQPLHDLFDARLREARLAHQIDDLAQQLVDLAAQALARVARWCASSPSQASFLATSASMRFTFAVLSRKSLRRSSWRRAPARGRRGRRGPSAGRCCPSAAAPRSARISRTPYGVASTAQLALVLAGLDALRDRDLALAREQRHLAHLAQVDAHRIVGRALGVGALDAARARRRLLVERRFGGSRVRRAMGGGSHGGFLLQHSFSASRAIAPRRAGAASREAARRRRRSVRASGA